MQSDWQTEKISRIIYFEGDAVATLFIRKGYRSAEFLMPLGSYRLRYAAGEQWYGEQIVFGSEAVYAEADDDFVFSEDAGDYSGYTVDLVMQEGGNLSTQLISADQF